MINAYRIGVHIALHNGVSAGLGVIAGHMAGLQRQIDSAQLGLNRLGMAIAGLGAVAVGGAMLHGVMGAVQAGEELVNQQGVLKAAGLTNQQIAEATTRAYEVGTKVLGTSVAENLKALGELRTVFGDLKEAEAFLPDFQRLALTLGAVTGKNPGNAAYMAARFMDLSGGVFKPGTHEISPEALQANLQRLTQVVVATHGRVGPNEMLNFAQQAGPFVRGMSPEALYGSIPAVIQAMGGHRTGTAVAAMGALVTSGVAPQRIVADLTKFGLVDPSKVTATRTGVRLAPGAIVGSQQFLQDPFAWFNTVFMEALRKHGVTGQQEVFEWISRLFGRQTAQRLGVEFFQGVEQIMRDKELIRQALGGTASYAAMLQTPSVAFKAVEEAWKSLTTAFGAPATRIAVQVAMKLAYGLSSLAAVVARYPNLAQAALLIASGLGVALTVIGALAIAAAAIGAIGGSVVAATIVAIGAGIGLLIAGLMAAQNVDWGQVGRILLGIGQFIYGFVERGITSFYQAMLSGPVRAMTEAFAQAVSWVRQQTDALVAVITAWSPMLGGAIDAFRTKAAEIISAIVGWVTGLPGRVWDAIKGNGPPAAAQAVPEGARKGTLGGSGRAGGFYAEEPVDPDAPARKSNFVPAPANDVALQPVVLMMDGRKVGEGVMPYFGRAALGPAQSATQMDQGRAVPVSMRWA